MNPEPRMINVAHMHGADCETRAFVLDEVRIEPREDSKSQRLIGHAAVFNQLSVDLGGFRERIEPGAFAEAIKADDVRAHFNHDENVVLGRVKSGTLKLSEDAVGLAFEIDPPDTQPARDLLVSIERGDVDQVSFAFQVKPEGEEWRKDKEHGWVRTIRKFARLWDVSPVTYAAYPQTAVALRGLGVAVAAERRSPEARSALPRLDASPLRGRAEWRAHPEALKRWKAGGPAARADEAVISISEVIGDFGEGSITAKRIAAMLRAIGAERDVLVQINSPGGDLFEGVAIYNLLREHKGRVTTRVTGLAASAASLVAMAGDARQVARASFMMIHNVWALVVGNRNDMREVAEQLEKFDDALADVYVRRTGNAPEAVRAMMDAETWFAGAEAIERGFADELTPADAEGEPKAAAVVQSLVFSKEESPASVNDGAGWTAAAARDWCEAHEFRADKLDETENSLRFRQIDPEACREGSFRTLTENFPRGVSAVACDAAEEPQERARGIENMRRRLSLAAAVC